MTLFLIGKKYSHGEHISDKFKIASPWMIGTQFYAFLVMSNCMILWSCTINLHHLAIPTPPVIFCLDLQRFLHVGLIYAVHVHMLFLFNYIKFLVLYLKICVGCCLVLGISFLYFTSWRLEGF